VVDIRVRDLQDIVVAVIESTRKEGQRARATELRFKMG
jgi:hypothetical protein